MSIPPRDALENGAYKARCKAAAAPNPGTILVKEEGRGDEKETQETEGACPIDAKLGSSEGEGSVKESRVSKVTYVRCTFVNIWVVTMGKAAAMADRTMVLAAKAEALYCLDASSRRYR